jgi:hypothetical protein
VSELGKALVFLGLLLLGLGVLMIAAGKLHLPLGRLPGDIRYRSEHTAFYFPLTTCILLSAVVSLVLWLIGKTHK